MPDIAIRPFRPSDRSALRALVTRVFPDRDPLERVATHLFATRGEGLLPLLGIRAPRFWLADGPDGVAGMIGLYRRAADDAPWVAWFGVGPEGRGRGLGRRLLEHAAETARREGHDRLRLYTSTHPSEAAAQRLYDRTGFRLTGRRRPLSWRLAGSPLEMLLRERAL
ncbi:GNAT family N-acetyltransferase [Jannaschia sp. Os4]|uniref:GNAT family N-acetyltransferase n=1 Tax=Jannaschia sp. Os4 TaxID=2807617 RepID=UPI00193AB5FF|nr:GNAT family N-acetyltransferase [Jannaschia sp. Os4]MBM2575014.1 GNAT family N-acetyltransferase [Jannaschia sp. Os4]